MTSEESALPQQVSTTHAAKALHIPLAEPAKAVPVNQEAVPVAQMVSTASSPLTNVKDSSKPLLTGYQKTAASGNKVTISNEVSQNNTLDDNQLATLSEGPVVNFSAAQTSFEECPVVSRDDQAYWGQMVTSSADQTYHGHQKMTFSSDQNVNTSQVTTASGDQTIYSDQMTAYYGQNVYRDKMKILSGDESIEEKQSNASAQKAQMTIVQIIKRRARKLTAQKQGIL